MFRLCRKPPSRLELIKQGVADRAGQAYDTLTDTLSHVPVDKFDDVRHNLAGTAAQAWDVVSHTAETVAQKASETRDAAAKLAADKAAAARDAAADAADKAASAKDAALKATAAKAAAARETAGNVAGAASDQVDAARATAERAQANAKQSARAALKAAQEHMPSRQQVAAVQEDVQERLHPVEVTTEDGVSKWLWLGVGMLIGVVIGILLAPTTGRRSRALVKDKLNQAGQGAAGFGATTVGKAADLSNRAAGVAHAVKAKVQGEEDDADDNTIADRVRTALGENAATAHLERINVECVDGVVTLRGPMLETPVQEAVKAVVAAVKGVREVKSDFLTTDAPEDSATFVG